MPHFVTLNGLGFNPNNGRPHTASFQLILFLLAEEFPGLLELQISLPQCKFEVNEQDPQTIPGSNLTIEGSLTRNSSGNTPTLCVSIKLVTSCIRTKDGLLN